MDRARKMAGRIAGNAPVAVEMALKSLYGAEENSMENALAFEATLFGLLASTGDMKEGMAAFLEKRRPVFEGS